MNQIHSIAVIGGGSFGTVLANMIAENGYPVSLWLRDDKLAMSMQNNSCNVRYLPELKLHPALSITTCIKSALNGADTVMFAIPSQAFRQVLEHACKYILPQQYLVTTTKGIEANHFLLMSQILEVFFPGQFIGVLSGPNLAREVAAKQLTGTVIASDHTDLRQRIQKILQSDYFRVYASNDRYGVELGGALKNIYAIAAGLTGALKLGENTRSMLITRSLAEMSRLAIHMGANPLTFLGLAGVGDLMVTCMSPLSRNYRIGYALGQGQTLNQAVKELNEVAEGINTIAIVKAKADALGISMPLVDGLYALLYQQTEITKITRTLMAREQNTDVEFILHRNDA